MYVVTRTCSTLALQRPAVITITHEGVCYCRGEGSGACCKVGGGLRSLHTGSRERVNSDWSFITRHATSNPTTPQDNIFIYPSIACILTFQRGCDLYILIQMCKHLRNYIPCQGLICFVLISLWISPPECVSVRRETSAFRDSTFSEYSCSRKKKEVSVYLTPAIQKSYFKIFPSVPEFY
jgi:hypothetical protein